MTNLHKALNKQVANLSVLYTKLHHFHWFVEGAMFLALHEKFEALYNEVDEKYDEIAERLIALGGIPASTMKDYLALTSLSEAVGKQKALEMVKLTIADLRLLVIEFKEVIVIASDLHDDATADIFISLVGSFEKQLWILGTLLK